MTAKRHLIIRAGQSNEADGNLVTLAAAAVAVPTRVGQHYGGRGFFGYTMRYMEERGYNCRWVMRAIGSTGWKVAWAGTTSGYGASGWDPNSYVENIVNICSRNKALFSDITILMQNGQQDSLGSVTKDEYRDSIKAIINRWLSATNATILVGLSFCGTNDANQITNYANNFEPAIEEVLTYYSGNPRVLRGVNCSRASGIGALSSADGIHAANAAGIAAGLKWGRRLVEVFGNP